MTTQEIYIVEPAKALKAFAKALKMKITKQNNSSNIKDEISQAVNELNLIKDGKLKGISTKELLNEL